MNLNFLTTSASRRLIAAVFAAALFPASVPAQSAPNASIDGVYNGSYAGDQGPTKFKLTLARQDNGTLTGVFTLYLLEGSDTNAYTCNVSGRYIAANRMVQLARGKWETPPPSGTNFQGMNGQFDPNGGQGAGEISGQMRARIASRFEAVRDPAESANIADEAAAGTAAPPLPVVAAQPRRPVANRPAASSPSSPAAPAPVASGPTAINGVYTGQYQYSDVLTGASVTAKLKFSIKSADDGSLSAVFTYELPRKPGSFITYKLAGRYDAKAHDQWGNRADPFQFTTLEPVGSAAQDALSTSKAKAAHVALNGPDALTGALTGSTPGGGEFNSGHFNATKDRTASADLDNVMAAQAGAGSSAAPAATVIRSEFDGIYHGTIADKEGPIPFKLTLWTQRENRGVDGALVTTDITGLLTVSLPEGSETREYTCELTGKHIPNRDFLLKIKRWENPPPRAVAGSGLGFKFDPDGAGQLSGHISDVSNYPFQAIRDTAESTNMPNLRLANNVRPDIQGVFNGTYTRGGESPTKFKLTIFRNAAPEGVGSGGAPQQVYRGARRLEQPLKGLATIYLPTGSGTKAYTYDLTGVETRDSEFELQVHEWVTVAPAGFENFRSMGFRGSLVLDLEHNSARIVSLPPGTALRSPQANRSWSTDFLPKFEATWDADESVDFRGTMAAQKAVGNKDRQAALQAHYELVKNAPPKELASKYLVRKSRTYWQDYQADMTREVFDGGYGSAIDQDVQFQESFCTYVDLFSKKYRADLPARHETVTLTRYQGSVDSAGLYHAVALESWTVEVDTRFVAKYRQFVSALGSPGIGFSAALAVAAGVLTPRDLVNQLMAPSRDLERFFANNSGKSAAMRQLTENFLRGATGEPSLQQSGEKIDGAQAESDPGLPPGRYARFVDGANAFYRDPANAKYRGRNDTAFCQALAAWYQFKLTPEEEYYYANDFKTRFIDQIMQPSENSTDPEWPILHPAVEACTAKYR